MVQKGIGDVYELKQQIIKKPGEETNDDAVVETVQTLIEEGALEVPDPDSPIVKPTKKGRNRLVEEESGGGDD